MDELDILAKVYVKLYICQLFASVSYPLWKQGQNEYNQIIQAALSSTESELQNLPEKENEEKTKTSYEEDKYLKRLFVYQGKIFSKIEIMGIVTQIQSHSQGGTARKILYLDDTTGVIQCIIWKNKVQNFYEKTEQELSIGSYIRILGQVDYFANKFEVNVERFQILKTFLPELLFHTTLQNNLKAIKDANIYANLKVELTSGINKDNSVIESNLNNTSTINDKNLRLSVLKEFANRLLAFFQKFKLSCATDDDLGYTRISVKDLFNNDKIKEMMKDFLGDNEQEQMKDLQAVIVNMFEQNMFGTIIYKDKEEKNFEDADIEIKNDTKKILNEILEFITKKSEDDPSKGATFTEIAQYVNSIYRNFFTNDSIKYLLKQMIDDSLIYNLTPTSYLSNSM